jgi:hypothetical protein
VHVLAVDVTTRYEGRPVRKRLQEGAITEGIATSTSIVVYFDRFMFPATVNRQAICIHASTSPVQSFADCTGPAPLFLEPDYNPVARTATYRLQEIYPMDPPEQVSARRFAADTVYRVTIFVPPSPDQTGFFAFDGATLDRAYTFDFRTQAPGGDDQNEIAPSEKNYCRAIANLKACADEERMCHTGCKADFDACKEVCICNADPLMCADTVPTSCSNACGTDETCQTACDACLNTPPMGCTPVRDACDAGCVAQAEACRVPLRKYCLDDACSNNGDLWNGTQVTGDSLFGSCAFGQCHAPTGGTDPSAIAMGLDLSGPAALLATAIGRTSHFSQTGEASTTADESPLRFGRAMPIIDRQSPGNSYLLYKLLINPLNYARPGGVRDVQGFQLEIDRLRKSAIAGLPMPAQVGTEPAKSIIPEALDADGALSQQHLGLIDLWIASGAIFDCEAEGIVPSPDF